MRVQIVCRRTTLDELSLVLAKFTGVEIKACHGHFLVEVCNPDLIAADVLHVCRRNNRFAYIRIAAWEFGGGNERAGEASCVCGPGGQPLTPASYQVSLENKANGLHSLFTNRSELIVANVARMGTAYNLKVLRHRIVRRGLREDALFQRHAELGEAVDIRRWVDSFSSAMDPFIPVMRAVLRKVGCLYCTHTHYRSIEEVPTEGRTKR